MFSRQRFTKATVAIALASLAVVTACSSGASKSQENDINIWRWPSGISEENLNRARAKFPNLNIKQNIIGGDFTEKLTTTFTAKSGLPAITGLKGEDIAYFVDKADYFEDLNNFGFKNEAGDFVQWKVNEAKSASGAQIGYPTDIGPGVLFYRNDKFAEAGLPSDPEDLSKKMRTWDDFFAMAKTIKEKIPGTYLVNDAISLFGIKLAQSDKGFVAPDGTFIGTGDHIKKAWDLSIRSIKEGVSAGVEGGPDNQAMLNSGKMAASIGASWHLGDLKDTPSTSGKWRVTSAPGGNFNIGGSFLAIPKGTKNPEQAYKILSYLMGPEGQKEAYLKKGNMPASTKAMADPSLDQPNEFLGGQKPLEFFKRGAEGVPQRHEDAHDSALEAAYQKEIKLVEFQKKDPEMAWKDAVNAATDLAKKFGIKGA